MTKRLIRRQQVIDCNDDSCGPCKFRFGARCMFWVHAKSPPTLKWTHRGGYERLHICKASEDRG